MSGKVIVTCPLPMTRPTLIYCGDDGPAKEIVAQLIRDVAIRATGGARVMPPSTRLDYGFTVKSTESRRPGIGE